MKKILLITESNFKKIIKKDSNKKILFINEQDLIVPQDPAFNFKGVTTDNTSVKNIPRRNYAVGNEAEAEKSYQTSKHITPTSEYTHMRNAVLSFAVAFVPVVGPFVSAAIQLGDAALYYQEGNTKMAGLSGLFAFIPFVGPALKYVPKLANLGVNGMKNLGTKIGNGSALNKLETEALDELIKNNNVVAKEIEKAVAKKATEKTAETTISNTTKNSLLNLVKAPLNLTATFAKAAAPYIAVQQVYDKSYDYLQKDTPMGLATSEGADWNKVKAAFGSSGSADDNMKLREAWKNGWRPGTIVPEKYQTAAYKKTFQAEDENTNKLASMIAAAKQ